MARATLAGRPGSPGVGGRAAALAAAVAARHDRLAAATPRAPPPASFAIPTLRRRASGRPSRRRAPSSSSLARETASRAGDEIGAIFEAQALFATDPGIVEPALAAIDAGADAAEAIDRVTAEQADMLAGVDDEYFRERAADLRDVGRRVVDQLLGRARPALHHRDGAPAIVASDDLDPSVVAVHPAGARRRARPRRRGPDRPRGDRRPGARDPARPRAWGRRSMPASTASTSRSTAPAAGCSIEPTDRRDARPRRGAGDRDRRAGAARRRRRRCR